MDKAEVIQMVMDGMGLDSETAAECFDEAVRRMEAGDDAELILKEELELEPDLDVVLVLHNAMFEHRVKDPDEEFKGR